MTEQPGPERIAPNTAPGEIVVQVYAVPDGRLLQTEAGESVAMAAYEAGRNTIDILGQLKPGDSLMLVVYSGSTGERLPS